MFNDPYRPPLKNNMHHPTDSSDVRGIPVNIETRGLPTSYQQIGILNKVNSNDDIILPLMENEPWLVETNGNIILFLELEI